MTVGELLARISAAELTEWQAWAALHGGLGERRADRRSAALLALLANVYRRKGAPPARAEDFLPPEPGAPPKASGARDMGDLAAYLNTRTPKR
jgi:hypothetical protein